jgi:hypothetical protein
LLLLPLLGVDSDDDVVGLSRERLLLLAVVVVDLDEVLVIRLGDLLRVRVLRLCRELRRLDEELRRLVRCLFVRLLLRLLGDLDLLAV